MRFSKVAALVVSLLVLWTTAAGAASIDFSILRSLLMPGTGQAHKGHYTRAAIFAAAGIAGGVGVFISQIHYNRAVEKYNSNKEAYLVLGKQVENGDLVSYEDIEDTYAAMETAFNQAKRRYKWRNVFLATLIGSYTLNLVDMILSKSSEEKNPGFSVNIGKDSILLLKTFHF